MEKNPTGKRRIFLALILGSLAMLGPFNVDMYLPSFPEISADLGVKASLVQLSLTTFLCGLALGQFIIGPISDGVGRRKPLLISLVLFSISSLICAFAPNITVLIIGRFIQGMTAAGGIVLSRAVVSDTFTGKDFTKFYALLMVINATAPMIAPMTGGAVLLLPFATWHTIFYFLSVLGLVIFFIVATQLKESLPLERRQPISIQHSLKTMISLAGDRSYIGYALIVGVIHGGSFAYVAGTPFVYQGIYGVSPQVFSILFGINGLAIITGSFSVGRLSEKFHEHNLLKTGVLMAVSANILLLSMAIIQGPLVLIVLALFIYMTSIGIILTSASTLALRSQRHRAGSASALIGMLPLLVGSMMAPLVGLNESSAVPMGAIMLTTSSIGCLIFFTLTKKTAE
ncbi:Bcr/CflA family efflux MFS transporter [Metasolibacillus sp.]|uniref:Bcr/CflA family efflux MFS transporter n=1 Tax=Metasolibacillus sp. TaxID=2703680 RepID=UPI0025EAC2D9|nr:Bcr/CflA family efflux MFS transporter [Metasolibacillus sp.]MCT6926214.1 Bcr/CflA family efflux MFS transporter [Metasolibacillus sp.]MCT6942450.1 Bcr/CflA family efflux MFS transporter [Metasolibacillus sp.]